MPNDTSKPVTVDGFIRAESDMYFGRAVRGGGLGTFVHLRELTPIDHQMVIRLNRDTLYSSAVFDLNAGPVTVALPEAGGRFRSLMVVSEDHYVPLVVYDAGSYTFTKEVFGIRYIMAIVRTFADPFSADDLAKAHALQDSVRVDQPGGPGVFDVPSWDPASQKMIREALLALAANMTAFNHAFGTKDEVDPIHHLILTAAAWGGNPDRDAMYVGVGPKLNDGVVPHKLTVKDVPVDGFWSVSVYNKHGFFEKNARDAYSFNNITATPNADGSVTIYFGGDEGAPNYLPITPGWNYVVRLYRPRSEILNGKWRFPEATAITTTRDDPTIIVCPCLIL